MGATARRESNDANRLTFVDWVEPNAAARKQRRWLFVRKALCTVGAALAAVSLVNRHPGLILLGQGPMMAFVFSPALGVLAWALLGVPCIAALYVLFAIVEGRKTAVLYLRRFRFADAQHAMIRVSEAGLGRRYRIVTLDDSTFQALEVPARERRIARYGPWLLGTALIAVAGGSLIGTLMSFGPWSPVPIILGLGIILTSGSPFIIGLIWLCVLAFATMLVHRRRVRRRAHLAVQTDSDVRRCLLAVAALGSYRRSPPLMAPQATVARVADGYWQEVVRQLLTHTGAAIVDVSVLTPNLLWELERLRAHGFERCVLVGLESHVGMWSGIEPPSEDAARAQALLAGRTILHYRAGGWRQRRRFRRSLTNALDNVAVRNRPGPGIRWVERVRGLWHGITAYGLTLTATTILYFGLIVLVARLLRAIE